MRGVLFVQTVCRAADRTGQVLLNAPKLRAVFNEFSVHSVSTADGDQGLLEAVVNARESPTYKGIASKVTRTAVSKTRCTHDVQ